MQCCDFPIMKNIEYKEKRHDFHTILERNLLKSKASVSVLENISSI